MEYLVITSAIGAELPIWAPEFLPLFLKGILVLAVTAGLTYILRNSSAALRYMLWTCGVVSLVMLPMLSALLPQIGLEVLPSENQAENTFQEFSLTSAYRTSSQFSVWSDFGGDLKQDK